MSRSQEHNYMYVMNGNDSEGVTRARNINLDVVLVTKKEQTKTCYQYVL
jgi:hypothetical protein